MGEYDLEDRLLKFALDVRQFVKKLPRSIAMIEDGKQLIRASGSVGANYIEANESLSKKDFVLRLKIARKEAKEARYWLHLLDHHEDVTCLREKQRLIQEAGEVLSILSAIINKVS